jgi:hypothetical protein
MSNTLLGYGAFADVIDLGDGTVAKAYRRRRHTVRADIPLDLHDRLTRRLFQVEAQAYDQLQGVPELETYLPRYFGRLDPAALGLPTSGQEEHLQGCGIRLERLVGSEDKIGNLPAELLNEAESVLKRIHESIGRAWVWDACAFYPGSRRALTLIDFALWRDLAEVTEFLEVDGYLADHVLRLTGLDDSAA